MFRKIINKGSLLVASLFIIGSVAMPGLVTVQPALAQSAAKDAIFEGAGATGQDDGTMLEDKASSITNILLFILGVVAVIVIVIGGIMYATSAGDASRTKMAKDTILYAVIGLIVAIIAYAVVNFVVTRFDN